MPTYQYACTACGHQLEAVQSFADEPLTECPTCEGRLRKIFSAVGIVFKGSGFYRTDSRGNGSGGRSDGQRDTGTKADGGKDTTAKDGGSKQSASAGTGTTASTSSGSAGSTGSNGSAGAKTTAGSSAG